MSPMPSGSRRMTSSVTPGRKVGLIMPTTPRQLEKVMTLRVMRGPVPRIHQSDRLDV